jgi:pyruvate dehydrogenase E2 component (dihydrolipoamide acetyltransferase)
VEVVVPDLGDFADVEIIDVLVKAGDRVEVEQGLITLETEKATMDVPSPAAGRVTELKVKVGDRVSTGSAVLVLQEEGGAAAAPGQPPQERATAGAQDERPEEDRTVLQPKLDAAPADDEPTVLQPKLAAGAATPESVRVPDLGDFSDVEIIEVLVAPGDSVTADQGVVTLETEKATMDVPSPAAGQVVELKVKVGDRVSAGDELLVLRRAAVAPQHAETAPRDAPRPSEAPPAPRSEQRAERAPQPAQRAAPIGVPAPSFTAAHASPSVRKLARELGVDLARVHGSGRKARVTADDVKAFVKEALRGGAPSAPVLPAVPVVDFAKFGPIAVEPLTRIQKISGPRLHASWVNIPHVTQHDEADITELEQTRTSLKEQAEERGIRLTPLAFVIRACVLALEEMPLFKSSLGADGESLVMKQYTHIGFAVDTPKGLVVPVIRDADKKDLYEIAKALATLSERARDGKLATDDIQGGVFSVSSLGGIGGRFFTPIINAPEVAILGVSRNQWQAVYRDGGFVPRLMVPLSLSYDHRVIDGAKAVRFTTRLGEILADVGRLVEAIP